MCVHVCIHACVYNWVCALADYLGSNVIWVLLVTLGDPIAARASKNIWHFWLVYKYWPSFAWIFAADI